MNCLGERQPHGGAPRRDWRQLVIAVLDRDILAQLVGGYRYHQERCAEAVAGRGVVAPPALTSLEHCYAEGAWVYRVTAAAGAAGPSRAHPTCGHYAQGEHVRVLQVANGWLRLEPAARRSRYSSAYRRGEEWAYRAALAALASHLADDLHCRAALHAAVAGWRHANIAACLRRDKRPADAVAECDCALLLLPRFGRALFRKGASLLEAGQL
ncbi:hypothetical protein EMIHUDRAFT_238773 [Emiliania huxleyi CCMP1516]|uniref:SH3 domain-containing protein n=2 Tax=Emiliania huxleyi TaxID=2903 RepID=A0A0D3JL50_EMIH1|nr:hypothetical protein EMIHUDRAFT_238773 [Emiliania huxleyi CCMP1516]EOD24235.1 hypothetical protein EMIHUDRAFT_238773 [Emiliania huxleyi CCMP1516]|eukprot:XP_005776664.1 hypothetical protein EMIHUDRAFT_238773 [Emiliania huxleyi CCMP1516]